MKNIKFVRYLILSLVSVLLVSCMATTDNSEESISTPENEILSEQAIEVPNEELAPKENLNFVDFSNDEFLAKYSYQKEWAQILSCKLFYEEDWEGAWYYNYQWDEERQLKGYPQLVVLNEAFAKLFRKGVTDSIDEMKEIDYYCNQLLISFNNRDSRIPMPPSDFWQTWDDN